MQTGTTSTNLNASWISNIQDNIIKSENMIRLAFNGCIDLIQYVSLPPESKELILSEAKLQNLKMLTGELVLLVVDLGEHINIEKSDKHITLLRRIRSDLDNQNNYIKVVKSNTKGLIISCSMTWLYNETLTFVEDIRREILFDISDLLYIKEQGLDTNKKW